MWLLVAIASAGPLAECEALHAERPYERAAFKCAYDRARRDGLYDEATPFVRAIVEDEPDNAWAVHTLGSLVSDQGEVEEAIGHFERARSLFDATGSLEGEDLLGRVYSRLNVGRYYWMLDRQADAETAYTEGGDLARQAGRDDLQNAARITLARHYIASRRDIGKAEAITRSVEAEVFPDGAYQTRLITLNTLKEIANLTDDAERQIETLERMLRMARAEGDDYTVAVVLVGMMDLVNDRPLVTQVLHEGDPLGAVRDYVARIEATSNVYSRAIAPCGLAAALRHAGRSDESTAAVDTCVERATALEDPWEIRTAHLQAAFIWAEVDPQRAEEHWDAAVEASDASETRGLLVERPRLAARMGDLEAVRTSLGPARTALAEIEREAGPGAAVRSRSELAVVGEWLAAVPEGATEPRDLPLALSIGEIVRGGAPENDVDIGALQAELAADEAIVAYQFPDRTGRGWAGVLTSERVWSVPLPETDLWASRIQAWVGILQRGEQADDASRALYADIIGPLGLSDTVRDVRIIADGPLYGLPFAALQTPEGFWGTEVAIRRSTHLVPDGPAPATSTSASVLGDPALVDSTLPALPRARSEALLLESSWPETRVAIGEEATLEWLLTEQVDWLHLAAHVEVDGTFPDRTAMPLADRPLTVAAVAAHDWGEPVVVLSACRSVDGVRVPNEAPLGLGRAFLDAGARSVLGSLWKLEDTEAEQFFSVLYGHLGTGATLGDALVDTRRTLAASGAPERAWAGIVLTGDGRPTIPAAARSSRIWMAGLVVGGVVSGGLILWLLLGRAGSQRRSA